MKYDDKMTIKDISLWLAGFGLLFASFSCWAGNSNVLTAGRFHTCGIKTDATIMCWGLDYSGQATPPSGTFTQISAGLYHNCGLKTDRTISCWGRNSEDQSSPVPPGTYLQVAAGSFHSCALKTDSTVICWGSNSDSQSSPLSGTFTQITAGYNFTCGLRANKTVECWGNAPAPPTNTFTYISAGRDDASVCGLKPDGTGTCWGKYSYDTLGYLSQLDTGIGFSVASSSPDNGGICGIKADKTVECWDIDDDPQSGTFTYVAVGGTHACGLRENGLVACWGGGSEATPPTGVTFKQPGGTVTPPPSTCTQAELNAQYNAGYLAGIAATGGIKLINISTRALIQGGAYNVIAGFIITGTGTQKVVIRGWGIEAGVDPTLTLQTYPEGTTLAINNSWQTDPRANEIPDQMKPTKATDAALLRYLQAGAYTAILSTTGAKGLGLIGVNSID